MQTVLEPQPYQMVVNLVGYKTLRLARKKLLSPWSVDGIIAHEAAPALIAQFGDRYDADNQAAREMDRPGETVSLPVPVVCTGAYNLLEGTDRVQIDLRPGATAAMEHLLGSGRRRIAYLTDDLPNRGGDARHTAYVAGMQGAGRPREFVATENDSRVCARETVRAYIQAHGCPEALFCHNDDLAIGAYRGLCDLGFKVPQDCALVGCDGIEDTEYLEVPITTIVQPLAEMCSRAWEYLERRIREPDAPVQITVLEPKLVIRESTANAVRCT